MSRTKLWKCERSFNPSRQHLFRVSIKVHAIQAYYFSILSPVGRFTLTKSSGMLWPLTFVTSLNKFGRTWSQFGKHHGLRRISCQFTWLEIRCLLSYLIWVRLSPLWIYNMDVEWKRLLRVRLDVYGEAHENAKSFWKDICNLRQYPNLDEKGQENL
jgi:hypothetical protein